MAPSSSFGASILKSNSLLEAEKQSSTPLSAFNVYPSSASSIFGERSRTSEDLPTVPPLTMSYQCRGGVSTSMGLPKVPLSCASCHSTLALKAAEAIDDLICL